MSETKQPAEIIESLIVEAINDAKERKYIYGSSRRTACGYVIAIKIQGSQKRDHWRAEFNTPDGKRISRSDFASRLGVA